MKKLELLRQEMKRRGADIVVIYSADDHAGEYVGEHDRVRAFITGFTGSAGTAVISANEAKLFTDGRYFLQAGKQLENTGFSLMRYGEAGVPTPEEYAASLAEKGSRLFVDGATMNLTQANALLKGLEAKGAELIWNQDIAGDLWENRPARSATEAFELEVKYAGESRESRLVRLREKIKEAGAEYFATGELNEIAWLLNIRAFDVPDNPVFNSFLIMNMESAVLYCSEAAVNDAVRAGLLKAGVMPAPYDQVYADASELTGMKVLIDPALTNYRLFSSLKLNNEIISQKSPVQLMKAIKNETEQKNEKQAHVYDGLALCRYIREVKNRVQSGETLTELGAADILEKYRKLQPSYIEKSFESIIAYGSNASIIHYSPTEESDTVILPEGFLLSDVGGQYYEGTTDVTRTFVMGNVTEEMKKRYTQVLIGHIDLGKAVFAPGTTGGALDMLARHALLSDGMNFRHGTGHGVGYLLSVHEGPQSIRQGNQGAVEEGMITSNEPGYYKDGEFGIRHENLVLSKFAMETEYGRFLCFENLTMVPFDREAIIPEMLSIAEKQWLNDYHKTVFDTLSPLMSEEEKSWLEDRCAAI